MTQIFRWISDIVGQRWRKNGQCWTNKHYWVLVLGMLSQQKCFKDQRISWLSFLCTGAWNQSLAALFFQKLEELQTSVVAVRMAQYSDRRYLQGEDHDQPAQTHQLPPVLGKELKKAHNWSQLYILDTRLDYSLHNYWWCCRLHSAEQDTWRYSNAHDNVIMFGIRTLAGSAGRQTPVTGAASKELCLRVLMPRTLLQVRFHLRWNHR